MPAERDTPISRPRRRRAASRLPLLLAAALVALVGLPAGAQEVLLEWSFDEGGELLYRQVQTTHNWTPMGEVVQRQASELRYEVLSVAADGTADLRVTHEAVQSSQEGPMGSTEYDSRTDAEPDDPGSAALAALVGTSFEMSIAPDGAVTVTSGLGEQMADAIDAIVADAPPGAEGQIREMMEASFGEEQLEAMAQQGSPQFPAEPIAPGEGWQHDSELTLPFGTLTSSYDFTLEDVTTRNGSEIARIVFTGAMGDLEGDPSNPMFAMMEISGGEIGGWIDFDVTRGLLVATEVESSMDMVMGGQSMQLESTQEIELVEGG